MLRLLLSPKRCFLILTLVQEKHLESCFSLRLPLQELFDILILFFVGQEIKKAGNTYSRTCSTTIGSESLTTVFGMGTGGPLRYRHRLKIIVSVKIRQLEQFSKQLSVLLSQESIKNMRLSDRPLVAVS